MPLVDGLYQRRSEKSIGSPVFWFNFQRLRGGSAPAFPVDAQASTVHSHQSTMTTGIKRRATAPGTA